MRHTLLGLLAAIIASAYAVELPDPWSDCQPRTAITLLAALRAPLDAKPDDQDLLGRAIMAYVNLSLGGDPALDGACGPWLGYARELAERRARARGGEPATLADAAPELWVRLLDGDAVGTTAMLARWDTDPEQPLYRALQARATRDVRAFRTRAASTAHEWYAAHSAAIEAHILDWDYRGPRPACDPIMIQHLDNRVQRSNNLAASIRAVYADVAWMLRSSDLDDATAGSAARTLIAGCGEQVAADASRSALVTQAIAAAGRLRSPERHPAALAAAVTATRASLAGPRGIMDGNRHRLVGLGDVAAWNRDRLYLAGWFHLFFAHDKEALTRDFIEPLRTSLPGSVMVARLAAGRNKVPRERYVELAEAIAREITDPEGVSPGLLSKPFGFLVAGHRASGKALAPAMIAARARRNVPARVCLADLAEACRLVGMPELVATEVVAAARRDPWHAALMAEARHVNPDRSLLRDLPAAAATMVHPQIDFRAVPFAGSSVSKEFGMRWRGSLRIETAGSYRLGIESDDGSRLRVGRHVIDNDGWHAMQVRSGLLALEPGWHPFELEFFQDGGGGGCRLLWQPPGTGELVPIPVTALAHGEDRRPGLLGELFTPTGGVRTILGPGDTEIASAEAMPWLPRLQINLALRLADSGRHEAAVAAFDRAQAMRPLWRDEWRSLISSLLLQAKPDGARAAALLWQHDCIGEWDHMNLIQQQLRKLGLQEAALAAMPAGHRACCMTNLLQARIAFDCADFPHAREALSRLATVPDVIGDHGAYHSLLLEQAAIDRIGQASSPDLRQLLATYQSEKALPCYQISARWLAGEVSWEDALHEAAADEWGDTLWYVRGLYHLTIGEHAAARADLAKVIVEHPDWHEAWTCQALLRWYDRQTPEALAALPRAPVITPRVAPGGPTKTTGDDF